MHGYEQGRTGREALVFGPPLFYDTRVCVGRVAIIRAFALARVCISICMATASSVHRTWLRKRMLQFQFSTVPVLCSISWAPHVAHRLASGPLTRFGTKINRTPALRSELRRALLHPHLAHALSSGSDGSASPLAQASTASQCAACSPPAGSTPGLCAAAKRGVLGLGTCIATQPDSLCCTSRTWDGSSSAKSTLAITCDLRLPCLAKSVRSRMIHRGGACSGSAKANAVAASGLSSKYLKSPVERRIQCALFIVYDIARVDRYDAANHVMHVHECRQHIVSSFY